MISPARAGAFVTGAAGVVGAIGAGTGWLYAHVSSRAVYLVGLLILAVAAGIIGYLAFVRLRGRYKRRHWWYFVGVLIITMVVTSEVLRSHNSTRVTEFVLAYVFVGLAVIPIFWLSFQLDAATHKQCPMCCERIKAPARICRYCGTRQVLDEVAGA
jgi:hypothetical protein